MKYSQISVIKLIILLCLSEAVEFEDDDTVIVEAGPDSESLDPRQDRQFVGQFGLPAGWPFQILGVHNPGLQPIQQQLKPGVGAGTCHTPRGDIGQCVTLRQCYPVLRAVGENDTLLNPGLAEALRSASGPCDTVIPKTHHRTDISERQSHNSICCSNQKPHQPTSLLPKPTTVGTTSSPPKHIYRPPFFGHRPPTPPPVSTSPPSFVPSNCGVGHITGGSETQPNKYPWVVALLNGQKQICGGSLIDSLHVLTAAHCIAHMGPHEVAKLRVLLGAHNVYQVSSGSVVKRVTRVIKHRLFSHRTLHNDIAILKLDSAASFTDRIRPICLSDDANNRFENQVAIVAGWGSVGEFLPQPQALREVFINIWTNDQCRSKYGNLAPGGIADHMMCAGSSDRDACRGDSGGPLMIQTDSVYRQIGLVSWGIGCGRFPGVYTRITHFLDWIEKNRRL